MLKLNKEKYLRILNSNGLAAALTALHHDKEKFEFETFEGSKGYQRDTWDFLEEVRNFSIELWDKNLEKNSAITTH